MIDDLREKLWWSSVNRENSRLIRLESISSSHSYSICTHPCEELFDILLIVFWPACYKCKQLSLKTALNIRLSLLWSISQGKLFSVLTCVPKVKMKPGTNWVAFPLSFDVIDTNLTFSTTLDMYGQCPRYCKKKYWCNFEKNSSEQAAALSFFNILIWTYSPRLLTSISMFEGK